MWIEFLLQESLVVLSRCVVLTTAEFQIGQMQLCGGEQPRCDRQCLAVPCDRLGILAARLVHFGQHQARFCEAFIRRGRLGEFAKGAIPFAHAHAFRAGLVALDRAFVGAGVLLGVHADRKSDQREQRKDRSEKRSPFAIKAERLVHERFGRCK